MGSREYLAEFAGTALLLLIGLSAVVIDFASGSPVPGWIPNEDVRRLLTGIMFAGGATAIVYSPLGRRSGGHINPAVTTAFLRLGKITWTSATWYWTAQFAGALTGAVAVRLLWGHLADQVDVGTTIPCSGGSAASVAVEAGMVFLLVTLIPSDALNLDFVLGNKVMVGTVNANREHFEAGVRDMTIAQAEFSGWLPRLLTHLVNGLENWQEAFGYLGTPGVIKVFVEVSPVAVS